MKTARSCLWRNDSIPRPPMLLAGAAIVGFLFVGLAITPSPISIRAPHDGSSVPSENWLPADRFIESGSPKQPLNETALGSHPRNGGLPSDEGRLALARQRNGAAGTERAPRSTPVHATVNTDKGRSAHRLLADIEGLIGTKERYTAAQIHQIIQSLDQLVDFGDAAVPVIKEFLWSLQDVDFSLSQDWELLDYPTLRLNLFGVLNRIGGSAATQAMAEVLPSTADPAEIGLLARTLETHAAGTYRTDILNAARDSLLGMHLSQQGNFRNAASLFAVFQDYGDASVIPTIEAIYPRWKSYAAAALASLPDGAGVSALIDLVDDRDTGTEQLDPFSVIMLAQASRRSTDAALFLLDLVETGYLSNSTLKSVSRVLAGDEFLLTTDGLNRSTRYPAKQVRAGGRSPSYMEYHAESAEKWSVADIEQNLMLLDQILATDVDPDASRSLEKSKTKLTVLLKKKNYGSMQ
jgi:hypothetical protein